MQRHVRALGDNPALRRLEAASLLWNTADQLYLVGLLVYAYAAAGNGGVALVGILQTLPPILVLPGLSRITSRIPTDHLLRTLVAIRLATLAAAAGVLAAGGPAPVVFALAALDGVAATLARPVRSTLVPQIARSPAELVSANVAISAGRSLAGLVGPAMAAVLLVTRDVTSTFVAGAAAIGAAWVLSLTVRGTKPLVMPVGRGRHDDGRATLLRTRHPRLVAAVAAVHQLTRGMLPVLLVAYAVEALGAGGGAVGVLNSAIGLGGLAGGALVMVVVRRFRLAGALTAALALWGVGLAIPAVVPLFPVAVAGLALAGLGKAVIEVTAVTLLQRTVPVAQRAGVFGTLEILVAGSVAAGAILAAGLVSVTGPTVALGIVGLATLVVAVASWRLLRDADDGAHVPEREIDLLRGVPMLRPLALCTTEELASGLRRVHAHPGTEIVRQGDAGDTFYVLEAGEAAIEVDGRRVRTLGPGDGFGEIALLEDTPRTATVRAMAPCVALAIDRQPFLAAVAGRREAALAAQEVVRGYLG